MALQNFGPDMSCAYDKAVQMMTVNAPVAVIAPAGTTFILTVDNFLNPYNGKPKTGYYIYTTDPKYGVQDSSQVSGLTLTVQVSAWATLTQANVQRIDVMTTVRKVSAGQIKIASDIPIDSGCRIQIVFPPDMPLTSDLTLVSSSGIINTGQVPPTAIDLPSRSFYLDGCTQYYSQVQNKLQMFKMMNKANVRQTQTFQVWLWALDLAGQAYPIANYINGIFLQQTDFSFGSVYSLFVTPLDTFLI